MPSSLDESRSEGFLASSSGTGYLWVEALVQLLTGLSLPEVVLVLSLRLATFCLPHFGSVHCLCCLYGVVVTCQFSSSLDECRSGMGPGLLILR